jgi:3-hydroxybutyryl-CoA dehydrogenase
MSRMNVGLNPAEASARRLTPPVPIAESTDSLEKDAMNRVAVAGSGVLGAQIAFQCAYRGFNVCVYDVSSDALAKLPKKWRQLAGIYQREVGATAEDTQSTIARLLSTDDLEVALRDADILIEAIPEDVEIKKEFFRRATQMAPVKTIFATNSSTLLPSVLATATDRPERFLALHFANNIWRQNVAEVMRHDGTDPAVFDTVARFAEGIGMVPVLIRKEQPGYIINSLLVPWLMAAMSLAVEEIADPHDVDRTWMIATGAPMGPFAILDIIGLRTPMQILGARAQQGDETALRRSEWLDREYLKRNRLGVETGEGFYSYPDPEFGKPRFLLPRSAARGVTHDPAPSD